MNSFTNKIKLLNVPYWKFPEFKAIAGYHAFVFTGFSPTVIKSAINRLRWSGR